MLYFLLKFSFIFYQILFSSNFLDSILMVSLNIKNQKHLKIRPIIFFPEILGCAFTLFC